MSDNNDLIAVLVSIVTVALGQYTFIIVYVLTLVLGCIGLNIINWVRRNGIFGKFRL